MTSCEPNRPIPVEANGVKMGPGQMSFASAVTNHGNQSRVYGVRDEAPALQPRFQPILLSNRQYGQVDGKPAVYFSTAEFEAGVSLFKHSLVAKFTVGRPSIAEIRKIFKENWLIKGRATISDIWDGRHLMIILDSEEDARIALTSPIRKVGHAMFRLFRYTPDYNPRHESTTTTKWVRLPGLHPGFFTRNYVAGIVNSFGEFLDLDNYTKACASLKYARACVEVDVARPIPGEVTIILSDGRKFCQRVEVEGNMAYCAFCKIHGHSLMDCRKKRKEPDVGNDQPPDKKKVVDPKAISTTNQGDGSENVKKSDIKDSQEGWTEVKTKKKNTKVKSTPIPKEKQDNVEKVFELLVNGDISKTVPDGRASESASHSPNNANPTEDYVAIGQHHNKVVDQHNLSEAVGISSYGGKNKHDDTLALVVFQGTNLKDDGGLLDDNVPMLEEEIVDNSESMQVGKTSDLQLDGDLHLDGGTSEASAAKYAKVPITADKDKQVVRSQFLDDYIKWAKVNGEFEDFLDYCKKKGFTHTYGSSITIEDSERVDEDRIITHNSDYEVCNQDDDTFRKPIPAKTRHRKNKG